MFWGGVKCILKNRFRFLWKNPEEATAILPGVTLDEVKAAFNVGDNFAGEMIKRKLEEFFTTNTDVEELPVLDGEGRIVAVLAKEKPVEQYLPWHTWNYGENNGVLAFLLQYRKIYLSSLENINMRGFYQQYATALPLTLLTKQNLIDALNDSESLLVYYEDIFPDSPVAKTQIITLFNRIQLEYSKLIGEEFHVEKDFASINEKNLDNLSEILSKFDDGYPTIAVLDDNENFIGSFTQNAFAWSFPNSNYPLYGELFIPYLDNESDMLLKARDVSAKYGATEAPIVKDGKIVASAVKHGGRWGALGKRTKDSPPLHWDLISDEVLQKFFNSGQKIIISSEAGDLRGFKERLSYLAEVAVMSKDNVEDYLTGKFDMFIFDAEIWMPSSTVKYRAATLYSNLLTEETRLYLERNGVKFIFFAGRGEISDLQSRRKIVDHVELPSVIEDGSFGDYAIYSDIVDNENLIIMGGQRRTTGAPTDAKNSIWVYGPCIAIGAYALKDEDTVESKLQALINRHNISYKVVNCAGAVNSDINNLHMLIDTPVKSGDIVIFFTGQEDFRQFPVFSLSSRYYIRDVFDSAKYRNLKCFVDTPTHMGPEGYQAVAEYIWDLTASDMIKNADIESQDIPPMNFKITKAKSYKMKNEELRRYLEKLKDKRVTAKNIGAIVMNCNPFTKGHRYLITKALEQVDFLYIFVVEEDLSEIGFVHRMAMAQANCDGLPKIMVLPSGKYMISSYTFAEYFSKKALQGQVITPANDVRIFGEHIAPCLRITKRFAGEEPFDSVTRQYNETMKEMLPKYGVAFEEIPRLALNDNDIISATKVREYLKNGDLSSCRPYLTKESYEYIKLNLEQIFNKEVTAI